MMFRWGWVVFLIVICVMASGVTSAPINAQEVPLPVLAFNGHEDKGTHVYLVNADGSHLRKIPTEIDFHATDWSPDGKQLVGYTEQGVAVVDLEGNMTFLAPHLPSSGYHARWSPDGAHILFFANEAEDNTGCNHTLYVVEPDGDDLRLLVPACNEDSHSLNGTVEWFPDSITYAYTFSLHQTPSREDPTSLDIEILPIFNYSVGIRNIELATEEQPFHSITGIIDFDIAPDGSKFAVTFPADSGEEYHPPRIGLVDLVDMTSIEFSTASFASETYHPVWSPDGTEIAFIYRPDSPYTQLLRIKIMDSIGNSIESFRIKLSRPEKVQWSPDGQYLAIRNPIFNESYPYAIYILARGHELPIAVIGDAKIRFNDSELLWQPTP
jgi:Tol biopolymer transport system component